MMGVLHWWCNGEANVSGMFYCLADEWAIIVQSEKKGVLMCNMSGYNPWSDNVQGQLKALISGTTLGLIVSRDSLRL